MSNNDSQVNTDDAIIVGRGIEKTFKDFWGRPKAKALKGVDITVPRGSIFGLLGPNGSGKSTLIKIMLGHLYPTKGRMAVFGKNPRNPATKLRLGYLPERSYLYKHLSASETLDLFGKLLSLSPQQIKTRSEQLLDMVGLGGVRDRQVGTFSHGMTRRMGLAQALLNDPDLIILDEPTAGLDPIGCREVKDLMLTLKKRGKTILLTTHLLADVEDVCDQLHLIYGGQTCAAGKAEDLLGHNALVRIEFPRTDADTMRQMIRPLQQVLPQDQIKLSNPRQSLENFFLETISRSSQQEGFDTSGARLGSGVASYLQAGQDAQLIEQASLEQQVELLENENFSRSTFAKEITEAPQKELVIDSVEVKKQVTGTAKETEESTKKSPAIVDVQIAQEPPLQKNTLTEEAATKVEASPCVEEFDKTEVEPAKNTQNNHASTFVSSTAEPTKIKEVIKSKVIEKRVTDTSIKLAPMLDLDENEQELFRSDLLDDLL